jgi:hypothetical protein
VIEQCSTDYHHCIPRLVLREERNQLKSLFRIHHQHLVLRWLTRRARQELRAAERSWISAARDRAHAGAAKVTATCSVPGPAGAVAAPPYNRHIPVSGLFSDTLQPLKTRNIA